MKGPQKLDKQYNVSPGQITRWKQNESVSTDAVDVFCKIIDREVGNIMKYSPDDDSVTGEDSIFSVIFWLWYTIVFFVWIVKTLFNVQIILPTSRPKPKRRKKLHGDENELTLTE